MVQNETQKILIAAAVQNFILDRRTRGLAPGSIRFYREKLYHFIEHFGNDRSVLSIGADELREFILHIQETHNPGGTHGVFRAIHALFYFVESEYTPNNWHNPIRKIKAPRNPAPLLDPAPPDVIDALIRACKYDTEYGARDRAILLLLQQTGMRAAELLSLNVDDVDMITRTAYIRHGKGDKPRSTFFDRRAKTALNAYLKVRPQVQTNALFVSRYGDRMEYNGLRYVIIRRAEDAHVVAPSLHSFRRAFALDRLRAGVDLITLMRLMGHKSTMVLAQYLKQDDSDLRIAHDKSDR